MPAYFDTKPGGLTLFSGAWPRSGMMRNGIVYQRLASAPCTNETECASLPTPVAYDAAKTGKWPTPTARDWKGPQANEVKRSRGEESDFVSRSLPGAVRYPTPTAHAAHGNGYDGQLQTEIPGPLNPTLGRVAHGVPARVDRLRALGNAVVPQVAEVVGRIVLALEAERAAMTPTRHPPPQKQ